MMKDVPLLSGDDPGIHLLSVDSRVPTEYLRASLSVAPEAGDHYAICRETAELIGLFPRAISFQTDVASVT